MLFQTFLNSEHPKNEMPRYQFWERKRLREAEGKLRVFQQREKGCLHCQAEGKHKHRELPRTPLAADRSSCTAWPQSILRARQKDEPGVSAGDLGYGVLGEPRLFPT